VGSKPSKWLPLFEEFIKDLRISSKEETSADGLGTRLQLWESQTRFLREVAFGLDRGVRVFKCLKSRQLGVTTVSLAIDLFWLAINPGIVGALVTEDEKNRDKNRKVLKQYVDSFPEDYFGDAFKISGDNRNHMSFSNGSRLDFRVAGTKDKGTAWAEGEGYAFAHLCVAPGTPVILEHGWVKPIEDVKVGDRLLTHTGAPATVVDVLGQHNHKGPMYRITPWLGSPIYCTDEHTIPTQRGLVEARDLRKDDWLLMPVRPITADYHGDILDETRAVGHSQTSREGWVRQEAFGSGALVRFTKEFGFAIGYYLAEGCIKWQYGRGERQPCGITFVRHRSEGHYSDRAVAALREFVSSKVTQDDRANTLSTAVTVYGTPIARWIERTFGSTDTKRIPDEVFTWGTDFCEGLLTGLLCGDGSKTIPTAKARVRKYSDTTSSSGKKLGAPRGITDPDKRYPLNYVVLPTIRSSIATQARDLATSLGYGWASIRYQPAAELHGRMCKEQWRVSWSGQAAAGLCALMGLEVVPQNTRNEAQKYRIENGLVHIRIKRIEQGFDEPFMWDISVDHADHTFRTPSFAIGNTEVASYGSSDGLKSFEEAFAQKNPNRLYLYESTAKGFNIWRDSWIEGTQDIHTQHSFFIGWWASATNRIERDDPRFAMYGLERPTRDERERIDKVKALYGYEVSAEQLCWYRWRENSASSESDMLSQNQPWTADDAFILSGASFFQTRQIAKDIKIIADNPDSYGFIAYRYHFGNSFFEMMLHPLGDDDDADDIELKVWEEPVRGGKYVIGCDPAYGRNEHKDNICIEVYRCFADKLIQVAEYASYQTEVKYAAWALAHLAGAYGDCIVNVELGGGGRIIMNEWDHLRQQLNSDMYARHVKDSNWENALDQARWYLYTRPDSMGAGYALNFETTWRTKQELMHGMRGAYVTREIDIRSIAMLQEMQIVVQDGSTIGAPESRDPNSKDDRVFASAFAHRAWVNWRRPELMAQNATYERIIAEENGTASKHARSMNGMVERFFRGQALLAGMEMRTPTWRDDRGLI